MYFGVKALLARSLELRLWRVVKVAFADWRRYWGVDQLRLGP